MGDIYWVLQLKLNQAIHLAAQIHKIFFVDVISGNHSDSVDFISVNAIL